MDTIVIDNYDSFTFNLVHYLEQTGTNVKVFRNNKITINEIKDLSVDALVISPGPGRPEEAGNSMEIVKKFSGKIPILGVCLGLQVIGACFGAKIIHAKKVMHGKTSTIFSDGKNIYKGIKKPFQAMRYHSLAVDKKTMPACLKITAQTEDDEVMGLCHVDHPTQAVQFHPESIMTTVGKRLIRNFVKGVL
ncbi:MAG: aminodeoxychorismate/anthranilate synthase component II [Desulfobacula sp.]|nr:aminodeoxychorismate/anthranilate synthase component II [Desulfobacula sp.]